MATAISTSRPRRADVASAGLEPTIPDHDPALYDAQSQAEPIDGFRAIDDAAIAFYREHGWLAVANAFTSQRVDEAMAAIDDLVAGRNEKFNGVHFEEAAKDQAADVSPQKRLDLVRKLFYFVEFDPRLKALAYDAALTGAVSRLMGGKNIRLFQDMALLKPPQIGREKPWHQDHAYFDLDLSDQVVGVWVALDPADIENGCMHVLDRGQQLGPQLHWQRRDWQICDTQMMGKRSVAVPLEPGGALFFDSLLPHGTPKNCSARRRRAVQFHYCPTDAAKTPTEKRLAIFGTEGKDVTC